ncbi:hypothetical protein [Gracilibacillus oryzae]|nr:hypothetical protein [Gracilibacillus oryzae]
MQSRSIHTIKTEEQVESYAVKKQSYHQNRRASGKLCSQEAVIPSIICE